MSNYVSVTESAAIVRKALKTKLGLGARQVSVRADSFSMGSALRIRIKAPVSRAKVTAIAKGQESIDRCEYSGDILSGSNRYVTVDYDSDFVAAYGEQFKASLPAEGESVQITTLARCTNKGGRWHFYTAPFDGCGYMEIGSSNRVDIAASLWAERVLAAL